MVRATNISVLHTSPAWSGLVFLQFEDSIEHHALFPNALTGHDSQPHCAFDHIPYLRLLSKNYNILADYIVKYDYH